ncbi:hypothetical protein [Thomasclavelia ramosa]|nr:hypothetical protein [Thomasclavelia ramosa]
MEQMKEFYEVEDYKINEKISYEDIIKMMEEYMEEELCQDH